MPLSDTKVRALKPAEKPYKVSDGGGLHVLVKPNGSRLWRMAYRFSGKHKLLSFGQYPIVSLADARDLRDDAKRALRRGDDPSQLKRVEQRAEKRAVGSTFESVAMEWFEANRSRWVPAYSSVVLNRLRDDVFPQIGHMPIAAIEPTDVLAAIRLIEKRGSIEMGRRVLQMCSAAFRYGVADGRCPRDPTVDLRGALRAPNPVKHRTALRREDLPAFLAALDRYQGEPVTIAALRLALLTLLRTQEFRLAEWTEIEGLDGDAPIWRVPSQRMKMRRPHIVPLAPQAVSVLAELRRHSGQGQFLFPSPIGRKEGPISANTMIYAIYKMGYHSKATVHGFRSTASTILNEEGFSADWIEMQLAHVEGSVRSVYNHAQWLPGRREMMCWWGSFLDECRAFV